MVLLWNVHVQGSIHAIHTSLSCVNFFRKHVDRYYIRAGIDCSGVSSVAVKNNHAMSCQAENRGYFRILRRLNKGVKLGGVPIKVALQKFLLGSDPVLQFKAL